MMRNLLPGYQPRRPDELKELWDKAFFSVDTNVLVNLAGVSAESRAAGMAALDRVKSRLWLAHQTAAEYLRVRPSDRRAAFQKLAREIDQGVRDLEDRIAKAGVAPGDKVRDALATLARFTPEEPDWTAVEAFDVELEWLFRDRIGPAYLPEELVSRCARCRHRLEHKIPPGYADAKKDGNPYGDGLIWFQLLDEAKRRARPLIFVTEDQKEDWWLKAPDGKAIGPRPELVAEMRGAAGVDVHFYRWTEFVKHAGELAQEPVSPKAIAEFERASEDRERKERAERLAAATLPGLRSVTAALTGDFGRVGTLASFVNPPDLIAPAIRAMVEGQQREREEALARIVLGYDINRMARALMLGLGVGDADMDAEKLDEE